MAKSVPFPAEARSRVFSRHKTPCPRQISCKGRGVLPARGTLLRWNETVIPPMAFSRNQPFSGK
ncbi:MAG TPA: hypothetical protein DDX86_00045 [Akkermansia sp.]|nr:hypothetical protein [Akkermansia sp.]